MIDWLADDGGITRCQAEHPSEAYDGIALLLCVDCGNYLVVGLHCVSALLTRVAILAWPIFLEADAIARVSGGQQRAVAAGVLTGRLHFLTLVSPTTGCHGHMEGK